MRLIRKTPRARKKEKPLEKFDKNWGRHQVIYVKVGSLVRWCIDGPRKGFTIKVLNAWWRSSYSRGLLLLFIFAMNYFHLCQKYNKI
jgi:hypothetical protein